MPDFDGPRRNPSRPPDYESPRRNPKLPADFEDTRLPRRGPTLPLAVNILVIAALLTVALIGIFFLFSGREAENPVVETTPEAEEPSPTPEPTPTTPEEPPITAANYTVKGELHALGFRVRRGDSLTDAIRRDLPDQYRDLAAALANELGNALQPRLDLRRDLRPGDEGKVVFHPGAKFTDTPVYGFWYQSGRLEEELLYLGFLSKGDAALKYYDPDGKGIQAEMKNQPLAPADLAQAEVVRLGDNRGLVYNAPRGTRLLMPFPARIVRLNWDMENLGRSIEVRYLADDALAWFCFLEDVGEKVEPGEMINAGDPFATIGIDKQTSQPGLLYRTFRQTGDEEPKEISPLDLHQTEQAQLPKEDQVVFISIRAQVKELLAAIEVPKAD